jgi:hypothetical protein
VSVLGRKPISLATVERVNDMGVLEPQGACQRIYVGAGCWEVEFSDVSGYILSAAARNSFSERKN